MHIKGSAEHRLVDIGPTHENRSKADVIIVQRHRCYANLGPTLTLDYWPNVVKSMSDLCRFTGIVAKPMLAQTQRLSVGPM